LIIVAMKKLLLTSTLIASLTGGCSTSQASQTTPTTKTDNQAAESTISPAQTNKNTGTSTQAPSPTVQTHSDTIPCNPSGSLNYTLYRNDKYHFTFQCPEGLQVRFYQRTDRIGMLTVVAGKDTMITLTVGGPAVQLVLMQETTLDQTVINGIAMRKRLISDPVIGNPPVQDREVIYDCSHAGNSFTWWAIFRKNDTLTQNRVNQIVDSFKFTD
jgi:hypothetical protein